MKNYLLLFLFINYFAVFSYAQTDALLVSVTPPIPSNGISDTSTVDTALTIENGELWIWGFRDSGLQGNGIKFVPVTSPPARVNIFIEQGRHIVQTVAGSYHIVVLDDQGDVWSWGANNYEQAGGKVCIGQFINTPCKILSAINVVQIAAGESTSYALTQNGDIYSWGDNRYGQQGRGDNNENGLYQIPREYFNNKPVVQIGSAVDSGYAINTIGEVFAWGQEHADSFGYPNSGEQYHMRPEKLNISQDIAGSNITDICGGYRYTSYLTSDGTVYGIGELARLGQGVTESSTQKSTIPVKIISNSKALYCRYSGGMAITYNDEIYTWGISESHKDDLSLYGSKPTLRSYHPSLSKIDSGKEHIIYWTNKGNGFGIGNGEGYKFNQNGVSSINWPGRDLTFVTKAMRKIYGDNYTIAQ